MESGSPKTSTKTRRCSSAFPSYFCSRGANLSQGAGVEHRLPRVPKGTATATRRGPRGRPERGGKGGAHSRTPETLTVGRREDANILGEEEKKKKKASAPGWERLANRSFPHLGSVWHNSKWHQAASVPSSAYFPLFIMVCGGLRFLRAHSGYFKMPPQK